jgi:adenylate cyclase class IV
MPSNIEIKARLADLPRTRGLVAAISDTPPQTLRQRDTFFKCTTGRLKLRENGAGQAELIFYSRPDVSGAKQSDYEVTPVAEPELLWGVLARAAGRDADRGEDAGALSRRPDPGASRLC